MGDRSKIVLFHTEGEKGLYYYTQWSSHNVPKTIDRAMSLVFNARDYWGERERTNRDLLQMLLGITLPASIYEIYGHKSVYFEGFLDRANISDLDLWDSPAVIIDLPNASWYMVGRVQEGDFKVKSTEAFPIMSLRPPCAKLIAVVAARYGFNGAEAWVDTYGKGEIPSHAMSVLTSMDALEIPSFEEVLDRWKKEREEGDWEDREEGEG